MQKRYILFLIMILSSSLSYQTHNNNNNCYDNKLNLSLIKNKPKAISRYKASIYRPKMGQTDSTPLQTASMKMIDTNMLNSGKLMWVAVSRNLHARYGGKYRFGDKIKLYNCGKFSNKTYIIMDLMHQKWKNKIDILISNNDTINYYFKNVKIR